MSELVEQYKTLTVELTQLEQQVDRIKSEREVICGQLLRKDGKGHPYDMGDGMPMIVATTKIGTHYMAPKNKWQKSGHPPKATKAPRQPKAPKEKPAPKPSVRKAIIGGKLVTIPIDPRRGSSAPPPAPEPVVIPKPARVPVVQLPAPEPDVAVQVKNEGVQPVVVEASKVEIKLDPEPASEPVAAVPVKVEAPPKATKPAKIQKPGPDPEEDELAAALAALDVE